MVPVRLIHRSPLNFIGVVFPANHEAYDASPRLLVSQMSDDFTGAKFRLYRGFTHGAGML